MKRNAVFTLIKDVVFALIAWGICAFLIAALFQSNGVTPAEAKGLALFFAGIPFGWRWASKIITAVSFKGVMLKLGFSVVLGWLAIFVVLISDVIRCIAALISRRKQIRAAKAYGYSEM